METIHFSPTAVKGLGRKYETDDGFVVRPAKVFECGEYPDKRFSLTEEEADAACRAFEPVHNNVEHRPSVFDRLLGTTEGMFRQGSSLFASLRIPKAVDALLGDAPIPLSAEWTADPKRYRGTALTVNPRVLTAAAHAFTQAPDFKTFAAEHPSEAAELVTEALKAPDPAPKMPLTKEQIKEAAWSTFSADPKNAGVTKDEFLVAFAAPPSEATTKTEQDLRIEKLERDLAFSQKRDNERDDAEAAKRFYADLLEAQGGAKTCPAEREMVEAAFTAARAADRATTVDFTANAAGSHEANLREKFAARKAVFSLGGGRLKSAEEIDLTTKEASPLGGLEAHFAAQDAAKKETK